MAPPESDDGAGTYLQPAGPPGSAERRIWEPDTVLLWAGWESQGHTESGRRKLEHRRRRQ